MGEGAAQAQIFKLHRSHVLDPFDCGAASLNNFLKLYALTNQGSGGAQTYVAVVGGEDVVVGYYSLATGEVAHESAPPRVTKGMARHPIPVMLLARLATDITWQGRGLGAALLADAMRRTLQAADIAGIRALVVHAKDEKAQRFYRHFDFDVSPKDPLHLSILIKEIRRQLMDAP
jgi:GNAT superfamily N-acetyltransferase